MTWEEFAREPARTPCVPARLLYHGAPHTFSPDDPEIADIERLWNEFRPSLSFSEGGVRPHQQTSRTLCGATAKPDRFVCLQIAAGCRFVRSSRRNW